MDQYVDALRHGGRIEFALAVLTGAQVQGGVVGQIGEAGLAVVHTKAEGLAPFCGISRVSEAWQTVTHDVLPP